MAKEMVQETLHNGAPYDGNGWPPEDPAGFMAWFQERIDQIPPEFRAAARIEISCESSYYDSSIAHIEITYMRPETDEQYSSRLQREAKAAANAARVQEQNERAALAALLKKYGQPKTDA